MGGFGRGLLTVQRIEKLGYLIRSTAWRIGCSVRKKNRLLLHFISTDAAGVYDSEDFTRGRSNVGGEPWLLPSMLQALPRTRP